jgi:hypothetical protein
MKLRLMALLMCVFAVGFSACSSESEDDGDTTAKTYDIGDTGPGGGIIFFVDENDIYPDWKYLEAAPVSTELEGISWALNDVETLIPGGTSIHIGTGKENTEKIAVWLDGKNDTEMTAQIFRDLTFGGKSDWFLPSLYELMLMHDNLWYQEGFGDFSTDKYYQSTSEATATQIWWVEFDFGDYAGNMLKNEIASRARAARRF